MKLSYIFLGLTVATLIELSVQWKGNVCSRTICSYRRIRVCAYKIWNVCCAYKWIWEPNYQTVRYCCPGWTTSSSENCDRAICRSCVNGKCVRPNVCECSDGAIGSACNTLICNWERPCFPGQCTPGVGGAEPVCTCDTGFSNSNSDNSNMCRELQPDQEPEIYEVKSSFSFYERIQGQTAMEKYSIYVDSTMSNEVEEQWTNRPMYNWLNVNASGHYMPPDNYTIPGFVREYAIGIAKAEVHILHRKISLSGNGVDVVLDVTRPCSPEVTSLKPVQDTYFCRINETLDRAFDSGDNLTITFKVTSGGYRALQQINPRLANKTVQEYIGRLNETSMRYRFDLMKPSHPCINATVPCREMLALDEDITKNALALRWSGWTDRPSGMYRYAWEVFELKVDGNLVLREPEPLGPLKGPVEVNQSSSNTNSFSAIYRPPRPGVYSVILEASDKANNSLFVRRIALYDPESKVTIDADPERRLYASSANPVGDFTWQQNSIVDVVFTWVNHFVNLQHEEGKWLNKVLAYPPELENFIKNIPEESDQDDHEGSRTINEIPNRRAIVKFEIQSKKDSAEGKNQPAIPTGTWTDVGLNETFTIIGDVHNPVTSADTVTFWVRATDAMGNVKVDRTQVRFDDSPPNLSTEATFMRNQQVHGVPYSSSVSLKVFDMQSGMKRVDVYVYMTGTDILVNNFTMPIPSRPGANCNNGDLCYCTPTGCFEKQQVLAVSNCLLWVAKDLESDQAVTLKMDFRNMAGLTKTRTIQIDNVADLNGTRTYIGPKELRATDIGETTATVTWTHSQSCYTRTEMWLNYREDGQLKMTQLHHSATSHNLAGLKPGTEYIIELISQYGDVKSDPVPVFITTKGGGLAAGAVAGIVIGVLLFFILILLVVGFILFKLGFLAGIIGSRERKYRHEPKNVEATIVHTTAAKQTNRKSRWAFENTTYQKDDDIYMYGSMDLGEPWYIVPDDITLIEEIATGRFAKIYKAKYRESPKNVKEVAAKVLQDRSSEDAILLMLAKINFHATQVGEHRNLVAFIGAVMENDALGPVMVLEYCETGQLDKWLVKQRSNVSEEVFDRIQNFSLEIARAMEYLANKGIVHRKLAARNCLLTFLLEVKVTGFGPCRSDESQDDAKGDRIPVKWTAPECLKSLKQANEKSDVWSFGITLWEIFSMGGSPYADIRGRDLPNKVKGGYRLPRPEYAEDLHYRIMTDCWSDAPASRPVFRNIVDNLESSFGLRPDTDQNYYYQR